MDKIKKSHAISSLRRGTYKWRERWIAEKRSHIGRGEYVCETCGLITKKANTQIDHTDPVVDPTKGWEGFDIFIERLFVTADKLTRMCIPCHKEKSKNENLIRKETAKKQAKKETP